MLVNKHFNESAPPIICWARNVEFFLSRSSYYKRIARKGQRHRFLQIHTHPSNAVISGNGMVIFTSTQPREPRGRDSLTANGLCVLLQLRGQTKGMNIECNCFVG